MDQMTKELSDLGLSIESLRGDIKGLHSDINRLSEKIDDLRKCKNNHEERIHDMEMTYVCRKDIYEDVNSITQKINKTLESMSEQINTLSNDNVVNKVKIGIFVFAGSVIGSGIVSMVFTMVLNSMNGN